MSNEHLPLLVLPFALTMISAGFFWLWRTDRQQTDTLAFGVAFVGAAVAFTLLTVFSSNLQGPNVVLLLLSTAIALGTGLVGLSINQLRSAQFGLQGCAIIVGVALSFIVFMDNQLIALVVVGEIICLLFYSIAFGMCLHGPRRIPDLVIGGMFLGGSALFTARIHVFLDGFVNDVLNTTLLDTTYFNTLQFFSGIIILGCGASLLVACVERRILNQRRSDLTDPLSGVLTRRGFWSEAEQMIKTAGQSHARVCVVLCDIDHFKAINDTYGHSAGDKVISVVGRALQTMTRELDLCGRVGGEEFAVVLRGVGRDDASSIAERFRRAIRDHRHLCIDETMVTASFGVAEAKAGESFDTVYQRADEALYHAKNHGRDRVVIVEADGTMRDLKNVSMAMRRLQAA
ncbi:MAG: GGDEF domain-containing protein [Pseudomonadota bacterium]